MTERPDFYELISRNRRATWMLGLAFFLLLALVAIVISVGSGAGYIGVVVGLAIALGLSVSSYFTSMSLALNATGAKPASREEFPQLYNVVEGVAIAAAVPMPQVYVVDDPAPNAFATGRKPEKAAVAATTGLMEKLSRDELEGVMAHEIAHIRNHDIKVMTLAVATAGSIAIMVDLFWRMLWFGGGRRRNGNGNNPIAIIGVVVVAVLAPLAAAMLKAAVSRRRESLADASAVEITRYPTGLRKALEKLDADTTVVSRTSHATSHLWVESPDDHKSGHKGRQFNNMFDTHPPLRDRINLLRQMEGIDPYEGPEPALVEELTEQEPGGTHEVDAHPFTPAGWYHDPASDSGRYRYWDGHQWTQHLR
ncbi:MAG: M48 family metalloprotease [Acidimicrobiales bacterium]